MKKEQIQNRAKTLLQRVLAKQSHTKLTVQLTHKGRCCSAKGSVLKESRFRSIFGDTQKTVFADVCH